VSSTEQNRTRRRSSTEELRCSSKADRDPTQSRHFEPKFRSLASLAVWLYQEEELVQLVPEDLKKLPARAKRKLLKKLIQEYYQCCRRKCFK
jgi:hypothetical protein